MTIKIEDGVTMPIQLCPTFSEFTKAALSLNVGQSFFCELNTAGVHCRLVTAKARGYKFITRTVEGGTRVWRIE